jgi:hypothetical protein
MVNYKLGKIYKIHCNETGKDYYGSTCEPILSRRLTNHVAKYKQYLKGKTEFVTSYEIIKNDNYHIALVEKYPCESKDELLSREKYYIENYECVNKLHPMRSKQEYMALYTKNNKETILKKAKSYRENNKDKVKDCKGKWYLKNKNNVLKKRKECFLCECGISCTFGHKSRHKKTKKHQKYQKMVDEVAFLNKNYTEMIQKHKDMYGI